MERWQRRLRIVCLYIFPWATVSRMNARVYVHFECPDRHGESVEDYGIAFPWNVSKAKRQAKAYSVEAEDEFREMMGVH